MALTVISRGVVPGETLTNLYTVPPDSELTIRCLRVSPVLTTGVYNAYVEIFFAASNTAVPIFNAIPIPAQSVVDVVSAPYSLQAGDIIRVRNFTSGTNAYSLSAILKSV